MTSDSNWTMLVEKKVKKVHYEAVRCFVCHKAVSYIAELGRSIMQIDKKYTFSNPNVP